jgi:mannose-6-phosphate isomerase-like protein (cupin superfamily)
MSYPAALYLGAKGETTGRFHLADAAPDLLIGERTRVHYLATGANTGGHYGLYRWEMGAAPSGGGAHFHRTFSESFFILNGTVSLYDGEAWTDHSPGDFFHVPPGGIHAFRNSHGPATMLVLFAPGAPREGYFEELADIVGSGRQLSEEEWTDLYRRHDQYMV